MGLSFQMQNLLQNYLDVKISVMIKKKYFLLLGLLFPLTSFTYAQDNLKDSDLYKSRALAWHMDGQVVSDTVFTLQAPSNIISVVDGGGENVFFHRLSFSNNQEIIVLYDPYQKDTEAIEALGIDKETFVNLCKQKNIYSEIERKVSLKKCRLFGLYKLNELNFYVLCINVKKANIKKFNHSIKSLTLKNS